MEKTTKKTQKDVVEAKAKKTKTSTKPTAATDIDKTDIKSKKTTKPKIQSSIGNYELIISEKPSAAEKIAQALATSKMNVEKNGQVSYFEFERNGKKIVVVPAVGHLYGLKQSNGGWTYPVYEIQWLPTYEVDKGAAFSKPYLQTIAKLAKNASEFTVATDYDIEGETIAFNILKYACGNTDANASRMLFSTLTKEELQKSYDNKKPEILHSLAEAGTTRHALDWYWGINFSRALTLAVKAAGRYKILSSGRVQGPALEIIARREKEIQAFKPVPFWQIEAHFEKDNIQFIASYEKDKLWDKKEADKVFSDCKNENKATISSIQKKKLKQSPPTPFNLTDLQKEAYAVFKMSPRETQQIAQELYQNAWTSYPRTSSQKLPSALGLKNILSKLSMSKEYTSHINSVLTTNPDAKPNDGEKTDDAHPAIHPTGEMPDNIKINQRQKKVYDLIVRRFISTFAEPALREGLNVELLINKHKFRASGKRTISPGWHAIYGPYVRSEDVILPGITEKEALQIGKIDLLDKETQPPARYNESSLISELEKRNLGTKATRAEIINTLFTRGYAAGKRIEVTPLGMKVVETLEKNCPDILSEELTRKFEEGMEAIEKGTQKGENVLSEARNELTKIFTKFKSQEKAIGTDMLGAINETQKQQETLGPCLKCGKDLQIRRSKFGQFVGCSGYPECRNIYPLPKIGLIKKADKICEKCNTPIVTVIRKAKRPFNMCLDTKCETKAEWGKNKDKNNVKPENDKIDDKTSNSNEKLT